MYGYAKAYDDANIRGISNPAAYTWWLDVETGNSWSTSTSANRADLEGRRPTSRTSEPERAFTPPKRSGPKSWNSAVVEQPVHPAQLAGRSELACPGETQGALDAPLTAGGKVAITQYVSAGFDYDHSCL